MRSSPIQVGSGFYRVLASGNNSTTAIDPYGSLVAWGENQYGQLGTNSITTYSWIQLSNGDAHSLALRSDKTLWAWGLNSSGQLGTGDTVNRQSPTQISGSWLSVAAGASHSIAISSNNIAYAWGRNLEGQIGDTTVSSRSSPVQVGTNSWTKVATGNNYTLAISTDSTLWSWGQNNFYQLGDATTNNKSGPVQIGNSSWSQISAGYSNTLAIDINGLLYGWGTNTTGQTGTIKLFSWTQLSVGHGTGHSLGIRSDGRLYTWGYNGYGNLGLGDILPRSSPTQVGTSSWSQISAGGEYSVAIRSDGTLWGWGYNVSGNLGLGDTLSRSSPVQISSSSFSQISAGQNVTGQTTFAISNNRLYGCGYNNVFQLGLNDTIARSILVQIGTSSWSAVSAGYSHTLGITTTNKLFAWGKNDIGQTANNYTFSWTAVAAGSVHGFAIRSDGKLYAWGQNTAGQLGLGDIVPRSSPVQIGTSSWSQIGTGDSHVLAIRSDGALFGWGLNTSGQLGDITIVNRSSPVQIATGASWTYLPSIQGGSHSAVIRSDGTMWAWGSNTQGQLGDGTIVTKSSPVLVLGGLSWSRASLGTNNTYGITTLGTLYAWGNNSVGQLGGLTSPAMGTSDGRSAPAQIGSSSWMSVASVAANGVAAITIAGGLWAWGQNMSGQFGLGDTIDRSRPVQITTPTTSWTQVYGTGINGNNLFALDINGKLYGAGQNFAGRLGVGDGAYRSSLTQVTGGYSYVATPSSVASGDATYALTNSYVLQAWGAGTGGTLGNNTAGVSANSPIVISTGIDTLTSIPTIVGNSSWSQVSAGADTSFAIRSDSALFAWGLNTTGQLGLTNINTAGDTVNRSSPVQVGTSSWSIVRTANNKTFAIDINNTLFAWGANPLYQLAQGDTISRSSPVQVGTTSGFNTVAAGVNYILATQSITYNLYAWGVAAYGGMGFGDIISRSSPVQVASTNETFIVSPWQIGTSSWSAISAGLSHSAAITTDNKLFTWGNNSNGQLGFNMSFTISAGSSMTSVVRSDGSLWTWGLNTSGQLGDNSTVNRSSPVQVGLINGLLNNWSKVSNSNNTLTTYAIDNLGKLYAWGDNTSGVIGDNTTIAKSNPVQIGNSSWTMIVSGGITASTQAVYAIRSDGGLFAWGNNSGGQLANNTLPWAYSPIQIGSSSWSMVTAGEKFALAITSDNKLFAWGDNRAGQLGGVTPTTFSWSKISTGYYYTLAIRSDNRLFAWGLNSSYQLGDGTNTNRSSPVQISTGSWSQVLAGINNSYAIRSDGGLFIWGANDSGQLGDPTYATSFIRSVPAQLGTDSWIQISSMPYVSPLNPAVLAIRSNNVLYAWGSNVNGQLGDGTTINKSSPVQVSGGLSWNSVSVGGNHVLGISTTNKLYVWGNAKSSQGSSYDNGQLGGASSFSWTQLSTSGIHSLALRSDGKLLAWGVNDKGQLGDGTTLTRSSPVQIGTNSYTQISAGISNSFAIRSDGALFAWGDNSVGQLGLISQARSSPVQIGTGTQYSVYFNGSTDYLLATPSTTTPLNFGTGDFTIEMWVYLIANGTFLIDWRPTTTNGSYPGIYLSTSYLRYYVSVAGGDRIIGTTPLSLNTWYHVAVSRVSGSTNMYLNGVQEGSTFTDAQSYTIGTSVTIGASGYDGTTKFNGYMSNLRVIKGQGLFTGTFTPSTNALTTSTVDHTGAGAAASITGTVNLLTLQNSTASDNSSNNVRVDTVVANNSVLTKIDMLTVPFTQSYTYNSWSLVAANKNYDPQGGATTSLYVLATRSDSTLYGWGLNYYGGLGNGAQQGTVNAINNSPVQVSGGGSWISISSAGHSLGIKSDYKLYGWGLNNIGQLANAGTIFSWSQMFAAGNNHSVAIRSDGTLWGWGQNSYGNLGLGDTTARQSPTQIGNSSWIQVAAGQGHTLAIRSDGTLWGWGYNGAGSVGTNTSEYGRSNPTQIGSASNWSKVYAGNNQSFGIRTDGSLWSWGTGDYGSLGLNDNIKSRSAPAQITTPVTSWSQVAVGNNNFAGAIDYLGRLYTWGTNYYGYLGFNSVTAYLAPGYSSPTQIPGTDSWISVAAGTYVMGGIKLNGSLWTWGYTTSGEFGDGSYNVARSSPVQVGTSSWTVLKSSAYTNFAGITTLGKLYAWGDNSNYQIGDGTNFNRSTVTQVAGTTSFTNVSVGQYHMLAIPTTSYIQAWGSNGSYQLGITDGLGGSYRSSPVQVGTSITTIISSPTKIGDSSWTIASAGASHSMAIRSDGTLWAWGFNTNGQLGLGVSDNTSRSSPVQVGTSTWTNVTAGINYSMAIRSDSTLWAWGLNAAGNLGTNNVTQYYSPVQVSGGGSWSQLNAGMLQYNAPYYTMSGAIDMTGKLFIWGYNTQGQLGIQTGDTINRSSPTQIGVNYDTYIYTPVKIGDSSWTIASAGTHHSAAIRSDGALFTWGSNITYGALGLGDTFNRSSPVQLPGTTSWISVSAGMTYTLALRNDGRLFAWGRNNNYGVLGDGTQTSQSSPILIGTSSWSMINAGNYVSGGVDINNSIYVWGDGTYGQIGDGTTNARTVPTRVGTTTSTIEYSPLQIGTSTWTSVSAGYSHAVGIKSDNTVYAWGLNNAGQLGDISIISRSSPVQVGTATSTLTNANAYSLYYDSAISGVRNMTTSTSSDWALGTDWTIEFFCYPINYPSTNAWIIYQTNTPGIRIYRDTNNNIWLQADGGTVRFGTSNPVPLNAWTHVAISATAGTVVVYFNGVVQTLSLNAGNGSYNLTATDGITLFNRPSGGTTQTNFNGYISNLRIVKGTSVYTSAFTTPTTPLTAITNTVLLMAQNTTVTTDNSGTSKVLTVNGTTPTYSLNTPFSSAIAAGAIFGLKVSAGASHSTMIDTTNKLYIWGLNNAGQLGLGDVANRSAPVQLITNNILFNNVSAGVSHTIASDITNSLYVWGDNTVGQIGDNTVILRSSPTQVGAITFMMPNVSSPTQVGTSAWNNISAGNNFTYGLSSANKLFVWGLGTQGQLGTGITISRSSPVQVSTSSYSLISVGGTHTTFVLNSTPQILLSSGLNTSGQLGDLSIISRSSPVQVTASVSRFDSPITVSVGNYSSYYVSSPTQVGTSSWTSVSAGGTHTLGVKNDNTLYAWGLNNYGQLGGSTTINNSSPVQIGSSSWSQVSAGDSHNVILKSDGTINTFGINNFGQLGDGT
jgi:alpha-tubulin suppressor-like RCC1 family protein